MEEIALETFSRKGCLMSQKVGELWKNSCSKVALEIYSRKVCLMSQKVGELWKNNYKALAARLYWKLIQERDASLQGTLPKVPSTQRFHCIHIVPTSGMSSCGYHNE